jgi:hypothetical protein
MAASRFTHGNRQDLSEVLESSSKQSQSYHTPEEIKEPLQKKICFAQGTTNDTTDGQLQGEL